MFYDYRIVLSMLLKEIRKIHDRRKLKKTSISSTKKSSTNIENPSEPEKLSLKDHIKYETRFRIIWDMSSVLLENESKNLKIKKAKIDKISNHASKIVCVEQSKECNVCIPEYFEKTPEEIITYNSPDLNLYALNNLYIIGQTHIILNNSQNTCLNELYFITNQRTDLSFGYLITTRRNTIYYAIENEYIKIDKGIYLINPANYNYYHFLYETLTRLIISDQLDSYRDWPILIDECVRATPNLTALLEMVNGSHDIIWIKKNKTYSVSELIYPDTYYWMPGNILKGKKSLPKDYIISADILFKLKDALSINLQEKDCYRRIFISRRNMSTSRLSNEKEVEELFRNAGFTIIYPETMTIHEQITIFYSANCIVGASGGALANILFCKPSTKLVCIIPEEHQFYMYSTIAKELGLINIFLDASIIYKTPYISSDKCYIDKDYITRFIDYYKSESL